MIHTGMHGAGVQVSYKVASEVVRMAYHNIYTDCDVAEYWCYYMPDWCFHRQSCCKGSSVEWEWTCDH
jgi:hypothetical protein